MFSASVRRDKQLKEEILGVTNDLRLGNYLGLPSLIGRSKKAVITFLKDIIWQRI